MEVTIEENEQTRLEKIVGPILIAVAGMGTGYIVQQNRKTLNQIPNGELATATLANMTLLAGKDVGFMFRTGRHGGHSENISTDIKYVSIFNISGTIGYGVGVLQDVMEKYLPQ